MDWSHAFRFSIRKYENESCSLGEFTDHRERSGSVGWPRTDIPGYVEARRRICCAPGKCGCVHDHATSTIAIQIQVIESQIPDPRFRARVSGARHQVLQSNAADGDVEILYEDVVQLKDASEEDDMGRSTVLEVSWPDDDFDVFESVED